MTDLLYERSDCVVLGFTDPSLRVPDVLARRFAVRVAIDILPRTVRSSDGRDVAIAQRLVSRDEVELFTGFDAETLYQHVAGMNAVRLRHGIRFAYVKHQNSGNALSTFATLLHELLAFKANTSADAFEVPAIAFDDIGGYADVKVELSSISEIVGGAAAIPGHLLHTLVPRGLIFHGPPGTGKTLFAKAIARHLGGTILVVSCPEITDKYVGEAERMVRSIFAQARRNAPAVVVFDDFDAIAGQRSGHHDSGSRAGSAIVAQLLTELDSFRATTPVLLIAATNRLDLIDQALLRPSRFRLIGVGLPTLDDRRTIAALHARRLGFDITPSVLDDIAGATDGMSGDEIASVFRDARSEEIIGGGRAADVDRFGHLIGSLRRRLETSSETTTRSTDIQDRHDEPRRTNISLPLQR